MPARGTGQIRVEKADYRRRRAVTDVVLQTDTYDRPGRVLSSSELRMVSG